MYLIIIYNAPRRIRTSNNLLRRQVLYPIELRAHSLFSIIFQFLRSRECKHHGFVERRGWDLNPRYLSVYMYSKHARSTGLRDLSKITFWRKEEDSNLRDSCEPNDFRDRPIQPLWHPSYNFK